MSRKVTTLPVLEQWDCHACGICCKAHTVFLDDDDLARLSSQNWDVHPELKGTTTTRRVGLLGRETVLAQQSDGSCVFLTEDGLCRIHRDFGEAAKPWACRMFPFQLIPAEKSVHLTMRRNCPSAAANKGRPLSEHVKYARQFIDKALPENARVGPPAVVSGAPRRWRDARVVLDAVQKIMLEPAPLVRRMVRASQLARSLAECKAKTLTGDKLAELVGIFADSDQEQLNQLFRERTRPDPRAGLLFRQAAANYARFHPNMADRPGPLDRLRLLWAALRIARGKGALPKIHPSLPHATFEDLERPLGALSHEMMQPLQSYFEAMVASTQFCGAGRFGWPVVDGVRALAVAYAVSLWLLRWQSAGREPTLDDVIEVVCMIDRSHFYPSLGTFSYRSTLRTLERLGQLDRLVVWYAR